MLRFGTNEVVVGRAAARQFAGLTVGSEIKAGQNSWTVVGIFESRGSVAETELWCDARFLQGAYRRGNSYQSVRVTARVAGVVHAVQGLADVEPAA